MNQHRMRRVLGIATVDLVAATPAGAFAAGALEPRCASDSVKAGDVCIDTDEASVWQIPPANAALVRRVQRGRATLANLINGGATQVSPASTCNPAFPATFDATGNWTSPLFAVSVAGVVPTSCVTWFQAEQACALSGQRLLTNQEWQRAAAGTPDPGTDDGEMDCNLGGLSRPLEAGSRAKCVSNWGTFDMVGNLVSSNRGMTAVRRALTPLFLAVTLSSGFVSLPNAALSIGGPNCVGDCDNSGTVTVDELVQGVGIALETLPLDRCQPFDCNGTGQVTVDCLVQAVNAALNGCGAGPTASPTHTRTPTPTGTPNDDEAALAAAARVATEPLFRLFDFQARIGTPGGVAGGSTASGCQQFDCVASGQVTGTEQDCCSDRQFTQVFDNCTFDDDLGRVVSLNGAFVLNADNFDVCRGAIPVGGSFTASLSNFTHDVFFPNGSFARTFQELNESFEVTTGGCTVRQPEKLGFGIRGDGRRVIDGELQQFQSDGAGNVLVDSDFDVHALEIVVGSTGQPDSCTVTAALNGSLTSADFRAGTQFSTDLTDLHVVQPPQAGALLLALNGTVGTDCLGVVTLSTIEPLRVAPGDTCFTGGRLQAQREGGTVAVTYADSGLDLDFGADGSVDQHFAACTDVPVDQCSTSMVGLCGACTAVGQCQGALSCFPCSQSCTGNTSRCSLSDAFVTCADGVF
jgi:hypothetical protein